VAILDAAAGTAMFRIGSARILLHDDEALRKVAMDRHRMEVE
jgi:hypothetical protein